MAAWVNPDNTQNNSTGIFDLLDSAIHEGGAYLIADKTGATPQGYSKPTNTGAVPNDVSPASTTPTIFGAKAVIGGVDMRYVAAGFGILLIIGLILRR